MVRETARVPLRVHQEGRQGATKTCAGAVSTLTPFIRAPSVRFFPRPALRPLAGAGAGDVGHARFAVGCMQVGDELGVVLEERGGARPPRLAEPARMRLSARSPSLLPARSPPRSGERANRRCVVRRSRPRVRLARWRGSPTCRSPSARQPVLVIANDCVRAAPVDDRERAPTPANRREILDQRDAPRSGADPAQPLLELVLRGLSGETLAAMFRPLRCRSWRNRCP
jgi:hypothetical protein